MNKRWLIGGLVAAFALVGGLAFAQNVSNYTEQGGARTVVGGTLDVVSGGDLDIEAGGVLSIAGTTVTSSAAELNIMNGVNATAAELNSVADVSARVVVIVATDAITVAEHEGRVNMLAEVGGDAAVTLTMPEATGSGNVFKFWIGVVNTSDYIIAALTTDTFSGSIVVVTDGGDTIEAFEVDGTDDTLTFNGTTTGGVTIGDWVEFVDCLDTTWCVNGTMTGSGDEVTPASGS